MAAAFKDLDAMYIMQDFYAILNDWWKETDNHRGNLALSSELVAKTFVTKGVFVDIEPCRRGLISHCAQAKNPKAVTHAFTKPPEDLITQEDF